MNYAGPWWFVLAIGVVVAVQFRDWVWWNNWEDDEDERNPAPLLRAVWRMWRALDDAWFWIWWKKLWPVSNRLAELRRRFFPDPVEFYADQDGLFPWDWVLIGIGELWKMGEHDDRFIYDQSVKKNWDEFLKARGAEGSAERPEGL